MAEQGMRLDKLLAASGFGSRNDVKKLIRQGRVTIDGLPVRSADAKVQPAEQDIRVDDEPVVYEKYHYFMLNKPAGYISATSGGGPTVLDLLDEPFRDLFPCGRLDKDTEGLLLITDDGPLAHELLAPRHHVEKEYEVELRDPFRAEYVDLFAAGMTMADGTVFQPARLTQTEEKACRIILQEGKFHEIKRMFLAAGNEVVYLRRIRMKNLVLDETLAPGEYRKLTDEEVAGLRALLR